MAKNLDLIHTVVYLNAHQISHLDGVWNAVVAKMAELGVAENLRAVRRLPDFEYCESPSGSLRGVIDWVTDLSPPVELHSSDAAVKAAAETQWAQDTDKLVMIHAVIAQRFSAAHYKPKVPRVEE